MPKQIKILTLTKFYHPYRGGIETVVKNITDFNISKGHISDVICSNSAAFSEKNEIGKAQVLRSAQLLTLKSTSICPLMPWQIRSVIANYDIIHVHFPDPMTALSLYLNKPSQPIVIHWHSDIIKQKKLMSFFGPLQRWCLEEAAAIIVTSEDYAQNSEDLRPFKNKIVIVPIGIDSKNKLVQKTLEQKKKILSVGRLTSYKGFHNLIAAAKYLPDDYEITIVGNGENKTDLENLIQQLSLEHKIKLVGGLSGDDLHQLYKESTLFCLPSTQKSEAFGVVLVEAMSHSLPIVACQIAGSGVPWVNQNGESGLNVQTNNPQALAEAIQNILKDQITYSGFSERSFTRYEKLFKLEMMTKKISDIYFSVL